MLTGVAEWLYIVAEARDPGAGYFLLEPTPKPSSGLRGREVQLAPNLYAFLDRPGDRATVSVHLEHPLYGLAVFLICRKVEGLFDPLND